MLEDNRHLTQPPTCSNTRRSLLAAIAGVAALAVVPAVEAGERPVTLAEAAAMEFEPWTEGFDLNDPDLRATADHHLLIAHVASGIMLKTKAELITFRREISDEDVGLLMRDLDSAVAFLRTVLGMLEAAEARLFVAEAATATYA